MPDNYTYALLPLDAPDDDPRWRGWTEATRLGFHDRAATDEDVARTRDTFRADAMRMRGVWAERPGLPPHTPVSTFASCDKTINVGHGRTLPFDAITDVTVRASDRRQGLLRQQIVTDLTEARDRGLPLAALTASEASIYNRFGFAVATRVASVRVDARRWQLRTPATGRFELLQPADLGPHLEGIWDTIHATQRSSVARFAKHRARLTGQDPDGLEHPGVQRALLHFDDDGQADGYAVYRFVGYEPDARVKVQDLAATTTAAEAAIWDGLVNLDLVTILEHWSEPVQSPLQRALLNPRAMAVTGVEDLIWLRILDPVRALADRGWDADGDLVLDVTDPLELAGGTFRIAARGGRAEVTPTDAEPDLRLGVDALAAAYFGTTPIALLAEAGRVTGSAEAIRAGTRLFSVLDLPHNTVGF